jgi:nucleotide-binding universal stress UspA family protein
MTPFSRILVDLDATAAAHPAFDRAIELARQCGARVKLVDVVTVPATARGYLPRGAEQALTETRRTNLDRMAAAVDVPIEVGILSGSPAQAIIAEVMAGGFDLVVRSHARDLAAQPKPLGAIDMQLFRSCPCTVWAVGPGAQRAPSRIVAAVHANPHEPSEQALNTRIIDTARLMTGRDGELIVFQAWHAFGAEMLRSRYSPGEMTEYVQAAQASARADLDSLLREVALPGHARVELREGLPEDTLPPLVVSDGVDLVVMGTVARTGVAGLLMGNTAERLLPRLPCSVMAVKPAKFRAPEV